jgi:predicted RNase H-like HicB family nuclease
MAVFNVAAHWDAEARVWWAESSDVAGLVAEAETHDGLVAELRVLVPELLAANSPETKFDRIQIKLLSDQIEEVNYA